MNVLVIGSGGREHALAWKLAQSPHVDQVYVAPGNAGTGLDAVNVDIQPDNFAALIRFVRESNVGLTVVGPEAPLAGGITDAFAAEKLRILGPSRAAAQLEASKVFCKNLLRQAAVPTAEFRVFQTAQSARHYLDERESTPLVVKADGLAAGKGVFVCDDRSGALEAVEQIGEERVFGAAGDQIVIEERLDGEEASIIAITDGRTIVSLASSQDHKRAYDGDTGPNTGGMGAYSPAPVITDEILAVINQRILVPTVHAMKRNRTPFRGVLYAGLMITNQGPKVLEYNVRFGDPECQPLLMRLESDLFELIDAAVDNRLEELDALRWSSDAAVCVVMASDGYPGSYTQGKVIRGLSNAARDPAVKVFHAGTASLDGDVVTAGGRVLGATALGATTSAAKLGAYRAVKSIRWEGAWCRKDISDKALAHFSDAPPDDD